MPLEHKNNLTKALLDAFNQNKPQSDIIISNARHYEALSESQKAILEVKNGLAIGLSGDLLSYHLKDALRNIGSITGAIDIDKDILGTIFGKFCIGK
jgi:tRNA modification GTPase